MIKLFFNSKAKPTIVLTAKKETLFIELPDGTRKVEIGIGEKKSMTRRKLILAIRQVITLARSNKLKRTAIDWNDFVFPHLKLSPAELAELMGTNFEMANFQFVKYKTPPPEGWNFVKKIEVGGAVTTEVKKGFTKGQIIGEEVNRCRTLANTPGGEMTPTILANEAKRAAKGTSVKVRIFDERQMAKLKMGGVLGVAKGSAEKPRFIILEYMQGPRSLKPIVLVGKGVTFDTGGLNVKPGDYMYEMHMDMSGGAAVLSAVILAAKLKLKKNVVGLIPAVENMPSGSSYHPGDVLRTISGKTIEVMNTDAEGRIILADALGYAGRYNPRLVVDVATLTGAAAVALGQRASALFATDEETEKFFRDLGEETGDYVWPLPLWSEYEDDIKGTFGDWSNTGKSRYGGTITGALFLYQFTAAYTSPKKGPKIPWVHLDIASRMTTIEGEYLAKGASGVPVRLLTRLLEKF